MIQKLIAVSAPQAGNFSLLVQREVTKRKHARVAHRPNTGRCPALLAKPGARQLVGRIIRGSTRTGARLKAPGFAAVLGSRHGFFNPPQSLTRSLFNPLATLKRIPHQRLRWVAHLPVWRARASQPVPESSRAPCSSPRRVVRARRVGVRAGTGEKRRGYSRHPGCVSFGYFSLHKQRKVTCRGSATHKYASPQATQSQQR